MHADEAGFDLHVIRERLTAAVSGHRGADAADRLCDACVDLLHVDAAAISLIFDGTSTGTLGASSEPARRYDELQFTLGEGPCLDSVAGGRPVLVSDLADVTEVRWPMYAPAMLAEDISGVFAMPIALAGEYVGALDLYRHDVTVLQAIHLEGALAAAQLAEIPLLNLLTEDLQAAVGHSNADVWSDLHALSRVEISQATGMLIAQLDVDPTEALIRLRAYSYAANRSATDVAHDILYNGLRLDIDL